MIFFYHVPKTAGISVLHSAKQAIPGVHRRVLLTEMRAWMAELDCGRCDTSGIAFLSGHFAYGVHQRLPDNPQTFTFIRNPIDQTMSMHYESAKRPDIYPHGELRTLVSSRAGEPYFGNAQVRHLASDNGRPIVGPLTAAHLARAKAVVTAELTCFGITEYFSASLALMNERLKTSLVPRRENVSIGVSARDLDPDLLLLIWDANALDRDLYEHCRAVFLERLRSLNLPQPAHAALAV